MKEPHRVVPRRTRTFTLVPVAVATTLAILVTSGGVASADTVSDAAAAVASAEAQLAAEQARTEQAAEAYNAGMIKLDESQRAAQTAQEKLDQASAAVKSAQDRLATFAANAYRSSGTQQWAVLTDGNGPQDYLDRAGTLQSLSSSQDQALHDTQVARHQQDAAQQAADRALKQQKDVVAQLDAQRREVEAGVARAQQLLEQAQARQAEVVRQAQEARNRQALAEAQARAQSLAQQAQANRASLGALSGAASRDTVRASVTAAPAQTMAAPAATGGVAAVLATAMAQIGKPYVYGGSGPGAFDCSGLTMFAYRAAGVSLPHYTGAQYAAGRKVSRADLRPGDLVFFGSSLYHVGIYIGNNQMVDAPNSRSVVRVETLWGDFSGAVRILG